MSGERTEERARRPRRRRETTESVAAVCVRCRRSYAVAEMIAWADGMWCRDDAVAALQLEREGDPRVLGRELAGVSMAAAAARRDEARKLTAVPMMVEKDRTEE